MMGRAVGIERQGDVIFLATMWPQHVNVVTTCLGLTQYNATHTPQPVSKCPIAF